MATRHESAWPVGLQWTIWHLPRYAQGHESRSRQALPGHPPAFPFRGRRNGSARAGHAAVPHRVPGSSRRGNALRSARWLRRPRRALRT